MEDEDKNTLNIITSASESYVKCLNLSDEETERINKKVLADVIDNHVTSNTKIINTTASFYCNYAQKLVNNDKYSFILNYLKERNASGNKIFASLNSLFSFLELEISFNMGVFLINNYQPLSDFFSNINYKKIKDENSLEFFLYDIYCDINNININIEDNTIDSNYYSSDSIRMYLSEIGKFKVLTKEEEFELFKEYSEKKDELSKKTIAEHNLKLAFSIATRFARTYPDLELEDLVQFGNLGLLKAIECFDYSKGFKFSTYATWWIGQFIRRGISESSTAIRIPVHARESISKIKMFVAKYVSTHDKEPSVEEISAAVSLPVANVTNYLNIIRNLTTITSLEAPVGEEEDSTLSDFIPNDDLSIDVKIENNLVNEKVRDLLNTLDQRSAFVIKKRFGFYGKIYTLEEIGEELGITRERVRQIQNKALNKLKRPYKKAIMAKDESEFNTKFLDKKPLPPSINALAVIKGSSKYNYIMKHLPNNSKEIIEKKYGKELQSNNYIDNNNDRYLNEQILPKLDLLLKRFDFNSFKYDGIFKDKAKERGIVNYYSLPDSYKQILINLYGEDLQKSIVENNNYNLERSLYKYIIPELLKPVEFNDSYLNYKKIFTGKYKTLPNSYATLLMNVFPEYIIDFMVDNKDYDIDLVFGINYILSQVLTSNEYAFFKKYLEQLKFDFNLLDLDNDSKEKFIKGLYNKISKSPHLRKIAEELVSCMNEYIQNKDSFNLYSFFNAKEMPQLPLALNSLSFDKIAILKTIFPNGYDVVVNTKDYDCQLIKDFYNIIRELKITANSIVGYNYKEVFDETLFDLYRFCQYKFANSNFAQIVGALTEDEKKVLVYCLTYDGGLHDAILYASRRLGCDYSECFVVLKDALIRMAQYIDSINFRLNDTEQKYFENIVRKLRK